MTMSGKGKQKEVEVKRSPRKRYAIIEEDVASLPQQSVYIPCTFDLHISLGTYDAMLRQC